MAVAESILRGNALLEKKEYEEAIVFYDRALREQPTSFKAHLEKSIALHRMKRFEEALQSLYRAQTAAEKRGKRELYGQLFYRYCIVLCASDPKVAIKFLNLAEELNYNPQEIGLWTPQVEKKAKKLNTEEFSLTDKFASLEEALEYTQKFKTDDPIPLSSSSSESSNTPHQIASKDKDHDEHNIAKEKEELKKKMLNKDNLYPVPKNIRKDWFQSSSTVTVSLFIKNLPKDDRLKVHFSKSAISIEFPTSASSEFQYELGPLFGNIQTKYCSYRVFQTKLELYLEKDVDVKWKNLERAESDTPAESGNTEQASGASLSYPSSSKKGLDWSKTSISDDEGEEDARDENAFFQQLYKDADDDTRRAMMKSFVESNGTSLSTNWNEVSKKTFEISPPDGLEAKKWG